MVSPFPCRIPYQTSAKDRCATNQRSLFFKVASRKEFERGTGIRSTEMLKVNTSPCQDFILPEDTGVWVQNGNSQEPGNIV